MVVRKELQVGSEVVLEQRVGGEGVTLLGIVIEKQGSNYVVQLKGGKKRCKFDMTWGGRCKEDAVEGGDFCLRHREERCWCGEQATKICSETVFGGSLVCGAPLCSGHSCGKH